MQRSEGDTEKVSAKALRHLRNHEIGTMTSVLQMSESKGLTQEHPACGMQQI